jgi:hypothetical protein
MDRTAFGPRSASGMAGYRIGRDQSAPYSIRLRPPRAACNRCRFRKLYPLTRSHRRIRLPTFVAEHKTCEQPWGTVCAHFARASKTPAMFDRLRGEAPPTGLLVRPSPQARGQGACGAPKVGAAVPVLGETFAHDSFAHRVLTWDDATRGTVYKLVYESSHVAPRAVAPPSNWAQMNQTPPGITSHKWR